MSAALPFEKAVSPIDRGRPAHDVGADGRLAHHTQIHTAQLPGEGVQCGARSRRIGDVGHGAAKRTGIRGGQFIQQRPAPPGHADPVSVSRKAFGYRAADTGGSPYDNSPFHTGKCNERKRKKD